MARKFSPIDGAFIDENPLVGSDANIAQEVDVFAVHKEIELSIAVPIDKAEGPPPALSLLFAVEPQETVALAQHFLLLVEYGAPPHFENPLTRQKHPLAIVHDLPIIGEIPFMIHAHQPRQAIVAVAIEVDDAR